MFSQTEGRVDHKGVELSFGLEENMLFAIVVVPICKAVLIDAALASLHLESDAELVAVAEVIPVVVTLIDKAAACLVCFLVIVEERVDVCQGVRSSADDEAHMDSSYTYVCKSVVISFHKHSYAAFGIVSGNVDACDICIG